MQEVKKDEEFSIFHIDEHYDTLSSNMDYWLAECGNARQFSLKEYLDLCWDCGDQRIPVFQWDTYLSIFLELYKDQVESCVFATQKVGDEPNFNAILQPESKQLLSNATYFLERSRRWILNIDFDYFFCDFPNDKRNLMFSEEYIRALFQEFRKAWDQGTFACITICLSPDEGYSGSWDNAERILEIFNEVFGVPLDIS